MIEVDRRWAGVKNQPVSSILIPSTDAVGAKGGSSAPDWDHVPFDVGCARCGHDLRGRSDPICPACGLTFDWADAVPIERLTCAHCNYHLYGLQEKRCPECGNAPKPPEPEPPHFDIVISAKGVFLVVVLLALLLAAALT